MKNVRLLADIVQLDPAISSELASKLAGGVHLNIPINTWNVYVQALTGQMEDITVQVSRALSKLKQVYTCFVRDPTDIGVVTGDHRNIKNPHCSKWYLPRGATPKLRMQVGQAVPAEGGLGAGRNR